MQGCVSPTCDDLGRPVALPRAVRRVVSLVRIGGTSFGADDGPAAFPGVPAALVSGRHLTWYGPSLVEAHDVLRRQLDV